MSSPVTSARAAAHLSSFEVASNVVVGKASLPMDDAGPATTPIRALEDAVRPALERGRCFVSFSGGHDSSLVLATAVRVARAEGLDPAIPITWRFTAAPKAAESPGQDAVVAALALSEWIQLTADDQLDFVGPVAQQVLLRHGVLFPANAFLHAPMLARAAGGTVLTGFGGDEMFAPIARPRRPWPAAPRSGRHQGYPWLQPSAARRALRQVARESRRMPRDPAGRPRWRVERRRVELSRRALEVIAAPTNTRVENPLLDRTLLAAVERFGVSPTAVGGRSALLALLFGDHLPSACVQYRRTAIFNEVFWNRYSRRHIEAWDGGGVDGSIVDVGGLRAWWRREPATIFTALLAQQTWLAAQAAGTRAIIEWHPSASSLS